VVGEALDQVGSGLRLEQRRPRDGGGAGGNRTRVLERRTRSSPGAVSGVVFSVPALAL